ncbi:related to Probable nitronate monooxygenase [Zygosaccharomyces bailii]|nr:related to Probable nitronate monooxygenase [Zygosaccharomyces bailii]
MLLNKLMVKFPIIQAPMAGVSTPQLAAAVSNAGGLGMLGLGASNVEKALKMIEKTRSLTKKPFGVNLFCHKPAVRNKACEERWLNHLKPLFEAVGAKTPSEIKEIYRSFLKNPEMLEMLLKVRPAVVSFHFGIPPPETIKQLHDAGIYTMATATNLTEALEIEKSDIDAIVAQGFEAGGHRGVFDPDGLDEQLSTMVLLRLLLNATKLPIIAAGGIMDGYTARGMLDAGASAVQLGTAYILCHESAADDGYRDDLKSPRCRSTRMTAALSGRPARGITNRLITYTSKSQSLRPADYPIAYDAEKQLHAAEKPGQYEYAAHWAGQGAPLAREIPASELTVLIAKEMGM